jgi:hypothetical protein
MKPMYLVSLALMAVLAGCAGQQVGESQYVPAEGGPGYGGSGAAGDVNSVPGQRPPGGGEQAQGSSGSGVAGSGNAGTYGAGESSSGADMQKKCSLNEALKGAHSEQERQAILDQAMPGTTPDVRQQHLEMLRQQCH